VTEPRALGALQSPPELLAQAWPIGLALAAAPIPAPLKYHSPSCQGVTLNQGSFGACVTYSGAYIQADLELADEGRQLLPDVLDPLHTYALIKGLPWPLTSPSQDPSPGLNPIQLWSFTKANGWATKDGSPPRLDASYFMIGKPSSTAAFLDALQQTILQLGPCQFSSTWPNNWWLTDAYGFMPTPVGNAGGHAFECCGWEVHADGTFDTFHHQSWGVWGHDPEFPNHFRVHSTAWDSLGWEAWKVADLINTPEAEMTFVPYTPSDVAIGSIATLKTPGGIAATSLAGVDPAIRLFRIDTGATVVPTSLTYPIGESGTTPRAGVAESARLVSQAGIPAPLILLSRNAVVTPPPSSGYTQADIDKAVAAEKASFKAQVVSAVGAL
jgi:hypothetical protein